MGLREAVVAVLVLAACTPGERAPDDEAPPPTNATGSPSPTRTPRPDDAWTRMADAPAALSEVAAAAFDGEVWVAGGLTGDGDAARTVLVYAPRADRWRAGPDLPEGVHHAALAGGDRLYLAGGYLGRGFGTPSRDVWVLDDAGESWEPGPPLPDGRAAGAAAWDGERVVYGGGVSARGGVTGDVLTLADGRWRRLGSLERPREHLGAASDGDGRVWFLGGRTGGLSGNLPDVDLVTADRVRRIGSLPTARGGVAGFYHPAVGACLAGGEETGGTFTEVECVDGDGKTSRAPGLGHARHGVGAAVVGDAAFVVLGGERPGLAVSAMIERWRPS